MQVPKEGLLNDLLWSDPDNNAKGWSRNINRNGSYTFGRDIIKKFVKSNGLAWVIRSHQLQPEGQKLYAGGRLVSIWSAENYRDEFDNRPAFVWIEDTRTVKIPVSFGYAAMYVLEDLLLHTVTEATQDYPATFRKVKS